MSNWDKLCDPPKSALKEITGGRLKGFTDISPMWRIQAMTEVYGECGVGWKYSIDKIWTEPGSEGQVMCFVMVSLFTKTSVEIELCNRGKENIAAIVWSEAIPGVGGSFLVQKEKAGLYSSDEGFKMALTDALSVAMKALGVGANVYSGGGKYDTAPQGPMATFEELSPTQKERLKEMGMKTVGEVKAFLAWKTVERLNSEIGA